MATHGRGVRWYRSVFRNHDVESASNGDGRRSRRRQKLAAGLKVGVSIWALAASAALVITVVQSNRQIYDLEVGYANLVVDLNGRVQDAVAVSARNSRYVAQIAALEADREALVGQLADLGAAAAVTDSERRDLMAERSVLRGDIDQLRADLLGANADLVALEERLTLQTADLALAAVDRDAAVEEAALLRDQVADMTARLVDAEVRNDQLARQVDAASDTLSDTRLALAAAEQQTMSVLAELDAQQIIGEDLEGLLHDTMAVAVDLSVERDRLDVQADAMQDQIAALERDLGAERLARSDAEEALRIVTVAAANHLTEGDRLRDANGALIGQVGALEARIGNLATYQEEMFAQLRTAIDDHVWAVEQGLAVTGLDIEAMIEDIYGAEFYGVGGPMVPLLDEHIAGQPGWLDALESIALTDRAVELRDVANQLPIGWPVDEDVPISSGFGPRRDPLNGRTAMHQGVDFDGQYGDPIQATGPGTVIRAEWFSGYGRTVDIDHGFGLVSRYAHLQEILVEEGEPISYSDPIGLMGSSGRSTGSHLHYEVRVDDVPYDPMNFIRAGEHVYEIATSQDDD